LAESEGGLFRASRDAGCEMDGFLTEFPCGMCPLMDRCSENGIISPQTCVYFTKWLEFEGKDEFMREGYKAEDLF